MPKVLTLCSPLLPHGYSYTVAQFQIFAPLPLQERARPPREIVLIVSKYFIVIIITITFISGSMPLAHKPTAIFVTWVTN